MSNFCYARDKSRFILGNIYDWNVFVSFISFLNVAILVPSWPWFEKVDFITFLKIDKILYDSE